MNFMKQLFILLLFVAASCSTAKKATLTNPSSQPLMIDGKLFASVFQQRADEYRALCFQAYNLARLRLDAYTTSTTRPKAIITDIDETVLDNSPYAVHQALQGKDYEAASWFEWTARAEADTVPGAPSFLKYAASRGIEIFYITNRDEKERDVTMQNLRKYGLPNTDNEHLILKTGPSSKETRRHKVMQTHEVLLLIGDNLGDFSDLFDKKLPEERRTNTSLQASGFGNRFIVLPNPGYGDWESSLYQYKTLTPAQKDSILRKAVKTY